jgi:prepilin-type N-terminal cleavage/methylation domain-containing protein
MNNNTEKNIIKSSRKGCTLVELLVVVAILGILGAIGLQGVTKHIENTRKTAAKQAVDNIRGAVPAYMIGEKKSTPPSDLKVIIDQTGDEDPYLDGGEGALVDPWDGDYRIEIKGKRFVIISNGPDGSPNTEDDIRSDKIEKSRRD